MSPADEWEDTRNRGKGSHTLQRKSQEQCTTTRLDMRNKKIGYADNGLGKALVAIFFIKQNGKFSNESPK